MPLQLRRGNAAELSAITPAEGELVYVRPAPGDIPKLYVGDGSTQGGILMSGYSDTDAKDAFADSLDDGTHTGIAFSYNSTTKALSATVNLSDYEGVLKASAFNGTLVSDSSTVLVDAVSGTIPAENVVGTFTGEVIATSLEVNSVSSLDSSEVLFAHTIRSQSDIIAENEFVGNLRGNVTGNITGDVSGNLKTLTGTRSYDQELNVFYPNGIELQGGSTITSATNNIEFNITTARFTSNSFTVSKNGYIGGTPWVNISQYHNTADAENFTFNRARGTSTAPTAVTSGDDLSDIAFAGFDGTGFVAAGSISVSVDNTVSTNTVPTRISFLTMNDTGTLAERVRMNSYKVAFNVVPQLPSYANEATANSNIGTPANGMMYYDVLLGKIRAYAGGSWIDLH